MFDGNNASDFLRASPQLFNGNISRMATALAFPTGGDTAQGAAYHYDMLNHLGNVLVTVSDKRVITSPTESLADIHSLQDYYPFGMLMLGADGQPLL